ncbi:uncharacterized protein BDV17DRAFT_260199 [Aspergillus undulatus]|uniref:uncharacterized protein n=1 Tax=Aspergillus undulatus TaxID=1810928 RepID=UPI003CCD7415
MVAYINSTLFLLWSCLSTLALFLFSLIVLFIPISEASWNWESVHITMYKDFASHNLI